MPDSLNLGGRAMPPAEVTDGGCLDGDTVAFQDTGNLLVAHALRTEREHRFTQGHQAAAFRRCGRVLPGLGQQAFG